VCEHAGAGGTSRLFAQGEQRQHHRTNDSGSFRREQFVRTHTRRSRVARLWAALAALVVVPATLAVSSSSAGAAGSNTLTVKAGEYTYILSGAPKAGWTEIKFQNTGVEDHMLAMFKLKPGTTTAQLKKAVLSSDQNAFQAIAAPGGDPTVYGTPAPLSPKASTTTMTKLAPGTYGIACFFPAPDGTPHAAHGMYKILKVSGKSSATPPTDGVSEVTIADSGITAPSSGVPAHGWLKVTNSATAGRDLTLAKYTSDSATFDQANAYYSEYFSSGKVPAGDAPAMLQGGLGGLAQGGVGYVQVDFAKGRFAFVSSNNDTNNDPNPLHLDFTVG
jgi:hypothetical protein